VGRYTVHLLLMLVMLSHPAHPALHTRRPGLHLMRRLLLLPQPVRRGRLQRMPLAEATAIIFASPVIVVLLAAPSSAKRSAPCAGSP
jgi:drug/metabolite transporter (DMT)-like permease